MEEVDLNKRSIAIKLTPDEKILDFRELRRVFLETVELIFCRLNSCRRNFGPKTLECMMDIILPTAYVYSSAYWMCYKVRGVRLEDVCVCQRYELTCPHKLPDGSWRWIPQIYVTNDIYFAPSMLEGILTPKNLTFHAVVSPSFIDVLLDMTVALQNQKDGIVPYSHVTIISRYDLINEVHDLIKHGYLIFTPTPVMHPYYGFLLREQLLEQYRFFYRRMIVKTDTLPKFSLKRTNCYVRIVPLEVYDIATPPIYSVNTEPLTAYDYREINDMCEWMHVQAGDDVINPILEEFRSVANSQNEFEPLEEQDEGIRGERREEDGKGEEEREETEREVAEREEADREEAGREVAEREDDEIEEEVIEEEIIEEEEIHIVIKEEEMTIEEEEIIIIEVEVKAEDLLDEIYDEEIEVNQVAMLEIIHETDETIEERVGENEAERENEED